jgi:hypothetical protein
MQKRAFHWRAIAGQWTPHVGGETPRDFGPCGTVLDRNLPMLCQRPERDFPYLGEVSTPLDEGLLIPFYADCEGIGTIWVISGDFLSEVRPSGRPRTIKSAGPWPSPGQTFV